MVVIHVADGVAMSNSYITTETAKLSGYSKFTTGKVLFLSVTGAAVTVLVYMYLKTKPCTRVSTTLCYQETGPSGPSMMVTGRLNCKRTALNICENRRA